jgi:hypothetical protein
MVKSFAALSFSSNVLNALPLGLRSSKSITYSAIGFEFVTNKYS